MMCLGCLVDPLKSGIVQFNCQSFIDGVLLPDMANSCKWLELRLMDTAQTSLSLSLSLFQ